MEMEQSIERMKGLKDHEEIFEENRTFHALIARASGNKVLETFWSTISLLAFGGHHGVRYSVANQAAVIDAHAAILKACRARDPQAATKKMQAHVGDLENLVRKRYKSLLTQPMTVVARQSRRAPPKPKAKLSVVK